MDAHPGLAPSCLLPELYWRWKDQPGFYAMQVRSIAEEGYYRSVELSAVALKQDQADIRAICKEHSLTVSSWLTAVLEGQQLDLCSVDEPTRLKSVEVIKQYLPGAAACGSTTVALVSGADPGPDLREKGYNQAHRSLLSVCAEAANLGMAVMFEPLDRFAHKRRLVGPTHEAIALFARIRSDFPDFGFAFDTAHAALNKEDVVGAIELAGEQVVNVHLSNAVLDAFDPRYGDHHMLPGMPGFLTVDKAAEIVAAAAQLASGSGVPIRVAVEARATPTAGEQDVADRSMEFLKATFAQLASDAS